MCAVFSLQTLVKAVLGACLHIRQVVTRPVTVIGHTVSPHNSIARHFLVLFKQTKLKFTELEQH